jgi:antitoxin ParD1/3/4
MASMNISVPDSMQEWVQRRIESGEYASVSDYVRDLIRRDQDTHARRLSIDDVRRTIEQRRTSGGSLPADDVFPHLEEKLRRLAGQVPKGRCEFTRLAETDLSEIALHIAADSPKTALRFVDELRTQCHRLTEFAARNPFREEYGSGVRVAVHGH